MDLDISDYYKLQSTCSLNSQCTLVDMMEEILCSLVCKNILLAHSFPYIDCWVHTEMVDKGEPHQEL